MSATPYRLLYSTFMSASMPLISFWNAGCPEVKAWAKQYLWTSDGRSDDAFRTFLHCCRIWSFWEASSFSLALSTAGPTAVIVTLNLRSRKRLERSTPEAVSDLSSPFSFSCCASSSTLCSETGRPLTVAAVPGFVNQARAVHAKATAANAFAASLVFIGSFPRLWTTCYPEDPRVATNTE